MVAKQKFSIRYKILALLTLIPVIVLSIYLYMAIHIFIDDKLAYVFDSVSMMSKSVSVQSKTELESKYRVFRPIMQNFLNEYQFSQFAKDLFKEEPLLDFIGVYELQEGKYLPLSFLEKEEQLFFNTFSTLSEHGTYLSQSNLTGRFLAVNPKDESFILYEKVVDPSKLKTLFFVVGFKSPEFSSVFRDSKSNMTYLVHNDGQILFAPQENSFANLNESIDLSAMRTSTNSLVTGSTFSALNNKSEKMIISYSPVAFSDLYVVVVTEEDSALLGVQLLIRKSILFFGILICSTIIISILASGSLTRSLTELFVATKKVSEGDFNIRVEVKSSDEIGSLAESFNSMAEEVSRLLSETAEKARMETELQTAKLVQETLFPPPVTEFEHFKIAGNYEPASECGGDWWHYNKVGNKIYLWIGDATGHGAPAALLTSAAKSAATIIERFNASPSTAMDLLNKAIYDVSKGRLMMTFFIATYDLGSGELTYANASHEPPFLIKKSEQKIKKKDLIPLNEVNSPRLGQARETLYKETTILTDPKDIVVFYTDGLPDIRNKSNEAWGERGFLKSIIDSAQGSPTPTVMLDGIQVQMSSFREQSALVDDVTYFICQC